MVNAEKLQALIDTAKVLIDKQATECDSEFFVWHDKVMRVLAGIYGKQSDQYKSFEQITFKVTWAYAIGTANSSKIKACAMGLEKSIGILSSYLEEMKENNNQEDFGEKPTMGLYTVRHGMRAAQTKTYEISAKAYAALLRCCSSYYENLAWRYPVECSDGNGCCGVDLQELSDDLEFEVPNLFRADNGGICAPGDDDSYDQYALIDFIEFIAQNIRDIIRRDYHSYFRHDDISFGKTNVIAQKFIEDINETFEKTHLAYRLTDNLQIERIEDASVLTDKIEQDIEQIKEPGLKELLMEAIQKHKSPYPQDQKDAVEKIWDAFERMKTYYGNLSKKDSADAIIRDMANNREEYIDLFKTEFRSLTDIGNGFCIRHHETNKIDITDTRHYDYFFNRCLALIAIAIQFLK